MEGEPEEKKFKGYAIQAINHTWFLIQVLIQTNDKL